jgi:antitoxin MazE
MRAVIRKWGNSAAIRIPGAVLEAGRLQVDSEVELRAQRGKLVIEPVRRPDESLADLLERIRPDNVHTEVDTGGPVGREAL